MKKILSIFLAFIMCFQLSGCTTEKTNKISLSKNVSFTLNDVWQIQNTEANTIYYYYFATIKNKSNKEYSLANLSCEVASENGDTLNAIGQDQAIPSSVVYKDQSTYVYGYIGYINNDQKDIGLKFNKKDKFISFDSIDVRKSDSSDIQKAKEKSFTLFEDDSLQIKVSSKNIDYSFSNGTTTLNHLYISYKNKTDKRLVVPYFIPTATMNGLDLTTYTDKDFNNMDLEAYKKLDFTTDGMSPKTKDIVGTASGYILYYLTPNQKIQCDISFTFENAGLDFTSDTSKAFDIQLTSAAFGNKTTLKTGK